MNAPSSNLRLRQLARYFGTAGVAALVDLGGFLALVGPGLAIAPAAALSFWLATIVNYLLTARFVFAQAVSFGGYGRFLLAALVGFAINVGITLLSAWAFELAPTLAKLAGIAIAFLVNFTLNAIFVFPSCQNR